MTPRSRKSKGKLLQNHVRDLILKYNPELHPDDCKSTTMGETGLDIQLSPHARKSVPLAIECKSRAAFAVYKDYEQAVSNTKEGLEPVLVIKGNRKKPLAMVDLDYFIQLVRKANDT